MRLALRTAVRTFKKQPAFTLLAVVTLALGIGANTAVFSIVNAVLLRPLPYKDGAQLVWIWSVDSKRSLQQWTSYPDFLNWREQSRTLEQVAGWGKAEPILTGVGEPQRLQGAIVTTNFFTMLGVPPLLGTTYRSETGEPQGLTVVLSHRLWRRSFSSDVNVVGRAITLSERSHVVAAVMPPGFQFPIQPEPVDLWFLLRGDQFNPALRSRRDARLIEVIGRLRPNATVAQAQAEMGVIAANLSREYPSTNKDVGVRVVPAIRQMTRNIASVLVVLFAAVGCVLLIACVNVATLLLARAVGRRQEIAVRAALGGSRVRVGLELLVESLPLSIAGGSLGGLVAYWGLRALVPLIPMDVPRATEVGVDLAVLSFTVLASLLTGVIFGVAPAWHASKVDLAETLQQVTGTASGGRGGRRLSNVLVASEIALATILLAGAALFISSFSRLNESDPGFDPRNVLTFELSWPTQKYNRIQAAEAFQILQAKLQAIPGVLAASVGLQLPDRGSPMLDEVLPLIEIDGRGMAPDERLRTSVLTVQPGYFRALGIPLVRGREFNERDQLGGPMVTIINESLARAYFPNEDPIGKRLAMDSWAFLGRRTREIVGVAGDVKHRGLGTTAPFVYLPLAQYPESVAHVVVKTDGDPVAIVNAVRAAVRSLDQDQPLYDLQTLEQRIARSLAQDRFSAILLTLFAVLAVALAAGGLYGVLSYAVAERTKEIGIRMAVGAGIWDVLKLVLDQGMRLAVAGTAIGLVAALALTRAVQGLLFGITPVDPRSFAVVSLLLTLVAFLAGCIPALRATKADPIVALRHQ